MSSAKDIIVNPINAKAAGGIVKKIHYSGKVVNNSRLHFGVFLHGKLEGAMSFGCSMDIRRVSALVSGTGWNDFIELNRMAFSDSLPKYSESRALGVAIRLIRKSYPQIKWIISFSDATQCGDGVIYRASGFCLTGIKKNTQMLKMADGTIQAKKTLDNPNNSFNGKFGSKIARENGAKPLDGFQLRYVYFIDKTYKDKLAVPILPFSAIDDAGARMYKGEKYTRVKGQALEHHSSLGGSNPTCALQTSEVVNG